MEKELYIQKQILEETTLNDKKIIEEKIVAAGKLEKEINILNQK